MRKNSSIWILLLTVGLLEPEYDLPLQIDVLGQVRERYPEAGLIIAGSGSLEQLLRAHDVPGAMAACRLAAAYHGEWVAHA